MNAVNPYIERAARMTKENSENGTQRIVVVEELMREGNLKKVKCITHVMREQMWLLDEAFSGTIHELDWSFYHDGLKLWFTPEAQQFLEDLKMRDGTDPFMSYREREIRILRTTGDLSVNDGFDKLIHKRYHDCVTGNRHEKVSRAPPRWFLFIVSNHLCLISSSSSCSSSFSSSPASFFFFLDAARLAALR